MVFFWKKRGVWLQNSREFLFQYTDRLIPIQVFSYSDFGIRT